MSPGFSGSVAPRVARLHCPDDLQHFQSGAGESWGSLVPSQMVMAVVGQAIKEVFLSSGRSGSRSQILYFKSKNYEAGHVY